MSQRWQRSTIARRLSFIGACVCILLALVINRLAVLSGHWVISAVLVIGAFVLGFFYFGRRDRDSDTE